MANIRLKDLTNVSSIADTDVVMFDGEAGVRVTTWANLKNLIKQQCGINDLNTKIDDVLQAKNRPSNNVNDFKNGIYVIGDSNTMINAPSGYGVLAAFTTGNYTLQIFKSCVSSASHLYIRTGDGDTWAPWRRVSLTTAG